MTAMPATTTNSPIASFSERSVRSEATLAPGVVVSGKTDFAGFLGVRGGYAVGNFLPYAFVGVETVHDNVNVNVAPTQQ